jgi:hypothetical protein
MSQTLYIKQPPEQIPCWFCQQPCLAINPGMHRIEYWCHHHPGILVSVTCVKHDLPQDNCWFFNRIAVEITNYRLYWNFYSGNKVSLEHKRKKKDGSREYTFSAVSLVPWPPTFKTYPNTIFSNSPQQLRALLHYLQAKEEYQARFKYY